MAHLVSPMPIAPLSLDTGQRWRRRVHGSRCGRARRPRCKCVCEGKRHGEELPKPSLEGPKRLVNPPKPHLSKLKIERAIRPLKLPTAPGVKTP